MRIHKGDTVKVMTGKDRGKSGKVARVLPSLQKLVIDGLNMFKKHQRPKKQGEKGQLITVARPISASNVMLLCKGCDLPVRVGFRFEGNNKVRFCKKCKIGI